jgi:SagB-type dehydrogenase family enzyme
MEISNEIEKARGFLKDYIRLETDFSQTDQSLGVKSPPVQKPYSEEKQKSALPKPQDWKSISDKSIISAIRDRRSQRKYLSESLSLEELSFLLWATQGVKKNLGSTVLRNVPSAGNRHPFETYICISNIEGLAQGIYRYLPLEHELLFEFAAADMAGKITDATMGQFFAGTAPAVFVWTAIPYRTEWRYSIASYKVIAIDVGHVCQNLYLACEAIGAGTCAIAAYNQKLMDELIKVDGKEEFTVYLAPVGKV